MTIEKLLSGLREAIEELAEAAVRRHLARFAAGLAARRRGWRKPGPKPSLGAIEYAKATNKRLPPGAPRKRPPQTRRHYTDEFKAKIAAEVHAGPKGTMEKIGKREKISPSVISAWARGR